jgi:hypothetical protein
MKSWGDWNQIPDDLDDADEMDKMNDVAARQATSFPDPWDGDHAIEYWVWSGDQLVPATPIQQAEIQETERIASARRRLTRWHNEHGHQHMTARIRIVRGIRRPIASFRHMLRHDARPSIASSEAHDAATPAHRRDGES